MGYCEKCTQNISYLPPPPSIYNTHLTHWETTPPTLNLLSIIHRWLIAASWADYVNALVSRSMSISMSMWVCECEYEYMIYSCMSCLRECDSPAWFHVELIDEIRVNLRYLFKPRYCRQVVLVVVSYYV